MKAHGAAAHARAECLTHLALGLRLEIFFFGKPQASAIEDSLVWRAAQGRAEGEKVRDNPTLLRKSIKRDEKRKQKSTKEW